MMVDICVSHGEDADGIVSASMIKHAFSCETYLVDYTNLMPVLEEVAKKQDVERLFICDLGLSKANERRFLEILKSLRERPVEITYIDHHDPGAEVKDELGKMGVKLIHTTDECTSVQVYSAFEDKLPKRFSLLAACAAISDTMEHKPLAGKLLNMYDRQFVFFEATSLSYAIYDGQHNKDFLLSLVDELATLMPHEISSVLDHARSYAQRVSGNLALIEREAKRMQNIVYVQTRDLSTSIVANMLLAMHQDMQVAIAYKEKGDNCVISLRGSDSCRQHLGNIVNQLSTEMGGSGGGHGKACGALVPKTMLKEFIARVNSML